MTLRSITRQLKATWTHAKIGSVALVINKNELAVYGCQLDDIPLRMPDCTAMATSIAGWCQCETTWLLGIFRSIKRISGQFML